MSFTQNIIGRLPSYGAIYVVNTFTGIAYAYTTSYAELTGLPVSFSIVSPVQDFAMTTDGRLKYTGIPTKLFYVSAVVPALENSTNWISIKLYKNGSALTGSDVYANSMLRINNFEVSMSTNDYVSVFLKAKTSYASGRLASVMISATSVNRV